MSELQKGLQRPYWGAHAPQLECERPKIPQKETIGRKCKERRRKFLKRAAHARRKKYIYAMASKN